MNALVTLASLLRIGESDCEEFHDGFLAQPFNAVTSLAYCVIGIVIIGLAWRWDRWRARTLIYGACLVATGLGSVVFHGPQWPGSRFLHDFPIVLTILLIALHDLDLLSTRFRRVPLAFAVTGTALAVAAGVLPAFATLATGLLAAAAIVAEILIHRRRLRPAAEQLQRRLYAAIVGVAAVAGGVYAFGRTGSPVCDADSDFQLHGVWHIVSAVAFGLWWWLALAERRTDGPGSPACEAATGTLAP